MLSVAPRMRTGQYGLMDYALLILGLVNALLFTVLGVRSWRLGRRTAAPRARTQAYILGLVCAAFVVASTLRIGLQLVDIGALSEDAREVLLTWVQLITSIGALVVIIPALWMLRRLTVMFAKTDQFVTVLTDKVMHGSSRCWNTWRRARSAMPSSHKRSISHLRRRRRMSATS